MKIVPTAQQTVIPILCLLAASCFLLSPILPTYIKLRLLDFWHISCFSLRVSLSCSGCVYLQYSIACLPSRRKGLSWGHCPWFVQSYYCTPSLGTSLEPSCAFRHPWLSTCLLASHALMMAGFGQAESADWLTPRVFCKRDTVFSHAEIYFLSRRLRYL